MKKKFRRKTRGILFLRNLTPGVKSRFKSVVYRRDDCMADVCEALLILYTDNPDIVNDYLREVKKSRKGG